MEDFAGEYGLIEYGQNHEYQNCQQKKRDEMAKKLHLAQK